MEKCKPVAIPVTATEKLSREDGSLLSAEEASNHRSLVGALQYLTLIRPDIFFSVNKMCQFLAAPTTSHWSAVKRILQYLK